MTTATQTSATTELSLADKLAVLNEEQYRTIFAIYGTEGVQQYEEMFSKDVDSKKRALELSVFIEADKDEERRDKLMESIEEYYKEYIVINL